MKTVKAEMAGTVLEVKVKVGDKIAANQEIVVLESMKMEVPVVSPVAGTIKSVKKAAGDFVNEGEGLVDIE